MAKDTEKLIRQLSLISYLMAERRPVTALEIRRDVEGYSGMNEDAFARRFYADRAELESLSIQLTVDKPADGVAEQENYSLRPENFHLPAIAFTDEELASLQFALTLLDGEFAYAEPLRLALQQISWGRPSPLQAPDQRTVGLAITGSAGGHDLSQRLAKVETAIFRHKTITFDYYTMERDEVGARKVDPYHLLFQGGQFYLLGHSHERGALRVFRLSRMRGKVAYASKAEHDFRRPSDVDPRAYANRAEWQYGEPVGTAEIWVSDRIAWQVERHFGRFGTIEPAEGGGVVLRDPLRQRPPGRGLGPRPGRARARHGAARARRRSPTSASSSWPSATSTRSSCAAPVPRRSPDAARGGGASGPPRGRDPPGALRPARHPRLDPHRGRARRRAPARRGRLRPPAGVRPGAAGGRQRPERRELRRRVLRPLRRGRRGRLDRGRPRALLRQLRPPGAAAARRGQGARGRHRPHRRAPARGGADQRAREDRRRARGRPDGAGPARRARRRGRLRGRAGRLPGDRRPPPHRARVLPPRQGRVLRAGPWSPTRSSTAGRAGTSRPSTRARTTSATSAWTGSRRSRC